MAFGFEDPARGLIIEPAGRPARVQRYLVDFARAFADETAMLPSTPDMARPDFDLVFSLDIADRERARALGATYVPCFPDPALYGDPLPGASIGLSRNSQRAGPPATVCLFGPESTGKSTLAAAIARHYDTLHVTEYVRGFLDATGSPGTAADVPWIARGQRAAEIATASQVDDLLVCDTNLATIMLWSDILFGGSPAWLRDAALEQRFDLWLLTDIDVPFEPDPQRCFPAAEERAWLMQHCVSLLDRLGVTPVTLRGSPEERLRIAVDTIDRIR